MKTPTLETDRLLLRPFTYEDSEDVFTCWESDPDVAKYMFWTSHNDIEKTKEWISFEIGQIEKDDWYRFALVLKDTGELIGTGLIYFEEEVDASVEDTPGTVPGAVVLFAAESHPVTNAQTRQKASIKPTSQIIFFISSPRISF